MACDSRLESARSLQRGAAQLAAPKKLSFRRRQGWDKATPKYEQAATLFEEEENHHEAKICWEKAAEGHLALGDPAAAATALDRARAAAAAAADWPALVPCSSRAAELHLAAGRADSAAASLAAAALALEPVDPAAAASLHSRAFDVDSGDSSGSSTPTHKRPELVRHASDALKRATTRAMCRAFLSSVVLWLYAADAAAAAADLKAALETGGDDFAVSEECKAALDLMAAARTGEAANIAAVVQRWPCFKRLEGGVTAVARRLAADGDAAAWAAQLAGSDQH